MRLPIVIYTRLSRDETGHQTATHRQEQACRAFAELRGWEVARVFEDVDVSAYQRRVVRPAYEEMVRALEAKEAGGVVVWKLDRLVRRPADFERFWSTCEPRQVFLASATEPIDSSTELGLALVRILVTFAGLESATIGLRIRARQRELALAGRPPSGKAYGMSADWSSLVPAEAERIREAARRVLAGEATSAIAGDWNNHGVAGPSGWHDSTLRTLLRAPRLVGDRVYRGEVVARDCWPPILDRLTAAQVANRLAKRRRGGRTRSLTGLASGLCQCGRCGQDLLVMSRENGRFYGCPRQPTGCGRLYVGAAHLEHWLMHSVLHHITVPQPAGVIRPDPAVLAGLLHEESDALGQLAEDYYVRRDIGRGEFLSARAGILARFEATRRAADPGWRGTRMAFLADADPAAAWAALGEEGRRAVVHAEVQAIVVNPATRRGVFDSRRLELRRWDGRAPKQAPACTTPATCVVRHRPDSPGVVVLDPDEEWLDGKQAASLIGLPPRTVWTAVARGLMPAGTLHFRHRIRRVDVVEFLRRARIRPGQLAGLINRRLSVLGDPAPVAAPAEGETWLSTTEAQARLMLTRTRLYRAIDDGEEIRRARPGRVAAHRLRTPTPRRAGVALAGPRPTCGRIS